MGLRGQNAGDRLVTLETSISTDLDNALSQLVALSGVSKAAMVRQALNAFLTQVGVLYPEVAAPVTRTAGRTRSTQQKDTNA